MSDLLKILLTVVLIAVNGFFVAAEFAMIRIRRTRVEELAEAGQASAKVVLRNLQRLDTFLAATQLGVTIATLGLGSFGEPLMERFLQPVFRAARVASPHVAETLAYAVGLIVITVVEVTFGELLPKWSVIQSTERAATLVAYPMELFVRVFYPLILFLKWFASLFARLVGIKADAVGSEESAHSEDEIIAIVEHANRSGTIGESEATIVDNAFEFAHTQAREVMVPRVDIVALHTEWSLERNLEVAGASDYTRFPLCVASRDQIIGMVHSKALVQFAAQHPHASGDDLRSLLRELPIVPETKRIDALLREMQRTRSHMALVLDEYGGTAGIVTLEDIIEELIGEIQDEYDHPAPVERLSDDRIAINGAELLETAADELGVALPGGEDYQSLGGYARHVLRLPPVPGATALIDSYRVTVAEAKGQRIGRLTFDRLPAAAAAPALAGDGSDPGGA